MTVDGLQQSNSTNLIIKGIIALKAMSEIASALYLYNDSARYSVRDSYKFSISAPITVLIALSYFTSILPVYFWNRGFPKLNCRNMQAVCLVIFQKVVALPTGHRFIISTRTNS